MCVFTHALQAGRRAQLEWLHKEVQKCTDAAGRPPYGLWTDLTEHFNQHFGTSKTRPTLMAWYNRNKPTLTASTAVDHGSLTEAEFAWVCQAVDKCKAGTGRMPRKGWETIARGLHDEFGIMRTTTSLMLMYSRRRQSQQTAQEQGSGAGGEQLVQHL